MSIGIVASSNTNIVQLAKIATGSMGGTTITISSIPQNFRSLLIQASLQLSTQISGNVESYPQTRFNGDSGSNYSRCTLMFSTVNGQQNQTAMDIAVPGTNSLPNPRHSIVDWYIPNYSDTNKFKTMHTTITRTQSNVGGGGTSCERLLYLWRSTDAITSYSIITGGSGGSPTATFQAVSSLSVYGIGRI